MGAFCNEIELRKEANGSIQSDVEMDPSDDEEDCYTEYSPSSSGDNSDAFADSDEEASEEMEPLAWRVQQRLFSRRVFISTLVLFGCFSLSNQLFCLFVRYCVAASELHPDFNFRISITTSEANKTGFGHGTLGTSLLAAVFALLCFYCCVFAAIWTDLDFTKFYRACRGFLYDTLVVLCFSSISHRFCYGSYNNWTTFHHKDVFLCLLFLLAAKVQVIADSRTQNHIHNFEISFFPIVKQTFACTLYLFIITLYIYQLMIETHLK